MNRGVQNFLAATVILAATLGTAQALPFTELVVFGDSLADSGNNAFIFDNVVAPPGTPPGTLRTPTPISSPGFIPTFPYASNRYSNGPVWVEKFAADLGLSAQASVTGGTNFAFGGARTGPLGSSFPFSLSDQVSFFLNASGGSAPASALYVVEGGGNDARDAFALAAGGGNPTPVIAAYAANTASIVTRLEGAGARDIILANVPDLGNAPAIRALGAPAEAEATALAMAMNADLDSVIANLPMVAGADLRLLDLFGLEDRVVADPGAFGLTDATSACAFSATCIADPSGTFFWDGIHPTTAGQDILAGEALLLVPEPNSLVLLAIGLLALSAMRLRRAP
jgi:outer membrane lipase/esterase